MAYVNTLMTAREFGVFFFLLNIEIISREVEKMQSVQNAKSITMLEELK